MDSTAYLFDLLKIVLPALIVAGAIYLSAVCVLPTLLIDQMRTPFYFGGTSVLILVGVALDTVAQIETFMLSKNYDGFMKHAKVRGRAAYS